MSSVRQTSWGTATRWLTFQRSKGSDTPGKLAPSRSFTKPAQTPIAPTDGYRPKTATPSSAVATSDAPSSDDSVWRKATRWLTFGRSSKASESESLANREAQQRQRSNRAIQPHGNPSANIPAYLATARSAEAKGAPASPAHDLDVNSTPSLVRRSRRPPPDPAPKLQQDKLLAETQSTAIENPYAASLTTRASAAPADKDLAMIIASASQAWKTPASKDWSVVPSGTQLADDEETEAPATATNEGLKFVTPKIGKLRAAKADVASAGHERSTTATVATNSASTALDSSNGDLNGSGKMPRRDDLLAQRTTAAKASQQEEASDAESNGQAASQPPATQQAPATTWIAKKNDSVSPTDQSTTPSENASGAPATDVAASTADTNNSSTNSSTSSSPTSSELASGTPAPSTAEKQSDTRSVVAETFAATLFGRPQADSTPYSRGRSEPQGAGQAIKQQDSQFPLPATGDATPALTASNPTASGATPVATNEQRTDRQPLLSTFRTAPVSSQQAVAEPWPGRMGQGPYRMGTPPVREGQVTADASLQRETLLPKPVPATRTSPSMHSYYHRGLLPGMTRVATAPSRPTSTPAPATQPESVAQATPPAAQQAEGRPAKEMAPLVDATTYRHQLAQQHRSWPTTQTTATQGKEQDTADGTWLAAYQRLVANGAKPPAAEPSAGPVTRRSLSSDDSP